jgi:hypothetical protein
VSLLSLIKPRILAEFRLLASPDADRRSTKFKARKPKQIQMTKMQRTKTVGNGWRVLHGFRHSGLGF